MKPSKIVHDFSELGAGDCFSWFSFPGGHGFPGVTRRLTFAWFDRWLGADFVLGAVGSCTEPRNKVREGL